MSLANVGSWPGLAKAKFKLAAVNQSSKAHIPHMLRCNNLQFPVR
jgi:hypothetical protein